MGVGTATKKAFSPLGVWDEKASVLPPKLQIEKQFATFKRTVRGTIP
jgi:hypothetical protein